MQYNYADVGVNIDARLREANGRVALSASLEVSTVLQPENSTTRHPPNPTISQIRIEVNAMLEPGKRALVASIDDPVTMRKFDVAATITKVN